jgi:IclR family acetate operon transcriptional repressor
MKQSTVDPQAISSLSRGLRLLSVFSADDSEISISELARRADMPKSTTHRLVTDLVGFGALERGRTGVRLGVRLFELGHLVPDHRKLRELAMPFARDLAEATKLTANVAVREGTEIIYLEKITSNNLRVPHSRVGGRLPIHCTALGKSILAHSSSLLVESILAAPLEGLSSHSITDSDLLRRELSAVRQTGVAYDLEESQDGLFCVAAPVFARANRVVGALSVTGATSQGEARSWANLVRQAARGLSQRLGAAPSAAVA